MLPRFLTFARIPKTRTQSKWADATAMMSMIKESEVLVPRLLDLHSEPPKKKRDWLENPPFEDVFPIEHGDFPACHVSSRGCIHRKDYSDMRNCRIWDGKSLCKLHVLLSKTDFSCYLGARDTTGTVRDAAICKLFQPPKEFSNGAVSPIGSASWM